MVGVALAATAALAVALALRPGDRVLAADVYLVAVAALTLVGVIRQTTAGIGRERPSRLDLPPERPGRSPRPPELLKLEREVDLSMQTAFDAHYRLRPTLRRIAAARLSARGIDLDAPGCAGGAPDLRPGAGGFADGASSHAGPAEALLGPEAWELTRPDRPRPRRHEAPGPTLAAVEAAVAALERL